MTTYNPDHTFIDSTPREIWKAYRNGFPGALRRPEEMKKFLGDNPYPLFGFAAPDLEGSGEGKTVVLFPHVLKHDPDAYRTSQKTGDCVSHGTRNAVDITRAVEIEVKGEAEGFYVKGATEGIYGCRGHGGQGMSCAGAARWVTQKGGILLRKDYTKEFGHDLTNYKDSYKLGMGWGRKGVPDAVVAEARKHQVGSASLVGSTREVMDALANGYGLSVCSGFGFSSKRDQFGVSRQSGSWSHCMCIVGYDDSDAIRKRYKGPIFLIQNSWGCHSDDTEILTKEGWKLFADLHGGEDFATLDPASQSLIYQPASDVHEYDYSGHLLQFKWRGVDMLVTPNHRMYASRINRDASQPENWEIVEAEDCQGHWSFKKNAGWFDGNMTEIEVAGRTVDEEAWYTFLGFYMAEGSATRKTIKRGGKEWPAQVVSISSFKEVDHEVMAPVIEKIGFRFTEKRDKDGNLTGWHCHDKALFDVLHPLGKAGDKVLPQSVMQQPRSHLMALFNGMMQGDGSYSVTPTGERVCYYTGSKVLADQMQEICLKIGFCADIAVVDRRVQTSTSGIFRNLLEYHVRIKRKSVTPRNSQSGGTNALSIPYKGKVYCVTVPNGLIYTRRNGVACWGGNSFNSGPTHLNQPPGSFWITERDMRGMVNARGTFVFSGVDGFPPQNIPDWGYHWS